MALSDPQVVTYNAGSVNLPVTNVGTMSRTYSSADGSLVLDVSHVKTNKNRWRRLIRLRHNKIAADPFTSGKSLSFNMSVSVIVDVPNLGYTTSEQDLAIDALLKWCTGAGTTSSFDRVVAGES